MKEEPTIKAAVLTNSDKTLAGPIIVSANPPMLTASAKATDETRLIINKSIKYLIEVRICLVIMVIILYINSYYNGWVMLRKYPELFKDHNSHYPIYDSKFPFPEYIKETKKIISATRSNLQQDIDSVIHANSPFEYRPPHAKQGALLIHGLLDCPFQMQEIGMRLYQKGILVRSILLPGHGTVPGDLLNIKLETWLQAVQYGVESLAREVDTTYLIGFSTGASLGLYHALKNPSLFSKLVLIAPAIKIRSYLDFSTNLFPLLGRFWQRANWMTIAPENDYAKYQSIPFNAVYQVYRLTQSIKELSKTKPPLNPLFIILSQADSTVSAKASIQYFQQYEQAQSKLLLYCNPLIEKNDPQIETRGANYPELNIHHFSHVCLPISPDNPHYGLKGNYFETSHAHNKNNIIYGSFNKIENSFYDFLFRKKIVKMQHRRLTFNPDFEHMIQEIEQFIEI